MSNSFPNDSGVKHVLTAWKEKTDAEGSGDCRHSFTTTARTEAHKCCWLLSSLRVRVETSRRATVVAWGEGGIPEDLLAKVAGVTTGPCFPGWGPEELFQMCLPGSSASALAGPSEACTSSAGPREAPKYRCWEVIPQPQRGWLLPAGSAGHRGPGFWPALAAVPPVGRLSEVTAWPQDDQLLFLCHTGHQKGIGALQTLVLSPLLGMAAARHSPGLWWLASITMPHGASERHGSSPTLLCCSLGVAAEGNIRTRG